MHLQMQVRRRGEGYQGSLTRVSDQVCLPFSGVLELLAALERLTVDDDSTEPGRSGSQREPQ